MYDLLSTDFHGKCQIEFWSIVGEQAGCGESGRLVEAESGLLYSVALTFLNSMPLSGEFSNSNHRTVTLVRVHQVSKLNTVSKRSEFFTSRLTLQSPRATWSLALWGKVGWWMWSLVPCPWLRGEITALQALTPIWIHQMENKSLDSQAMV